MPSQSSRSFPAAFPAAVILMWAGPVAGGLLGLLGSRCRLKGEGRAWAGHSQDGVRTPCGSCLLVAAPQPRRLGPNALQQVS